MKVYLKNGDTYTEVRSKPLSNEAELQKLLHQHSNLIPLGLEANHQVVREFPTAAGPIDHLAIDSSGQILVVETKLAANADRRSVIAQAIDYAAQLTKYGPHKLLDTVRDRTEGDPIEGWFSSAIEREDFLRNLEGNLRDGRLTILIVMDQADPLLKDAVRFINRATSFDCYLAEISLAQLEGHEVVTVEVYGDETVEGRTDTGGRGTKTTMDRPTFIASKSEEELGDEARAFLEALDWANLNGGTTGPLKSGFYLAQTPFIGYNYIGWTYRSMDIWATAGVYDSMMKHLEGAPGPWRKRITIRPLKQGGKFGKVADVRVEGATEEEFRDLFGHYLLGPKA